MSAGRINRRQSLLGLVSPMIIGLGTGLVGTSSRAFAAVNPFTLGVASGDPSADGFVIWTRLAPEPLVPGGGLPAVAFDVDWEISRRSDMSVIERRGQAVATADYAHSVHVEVEGLEAGREYFYRFRAGGVLSPTGRVKTLPAAGSARSIRFASAGCQRYEDGWFTAWRRLAEDNPDFVIHYGDYIYEGRSAGLNSNRNRPTVRDLPGQPERCVTLDDYRQRYAIYKLDPDLQAAHAAAAFVMSFDDHEVEDSWAAESSSSTRSSTKLLMQRRTAGFQAWYEHLPLRRAQRPDGASVQAYRRLVVPGFMHILVLDTRQFRSPQICGNHWAASCTEAEESTRTMLGPTQEAWVAKRLTEFREPWLVLAQQVPFAPFVRLNKEQPEVIIEHWDGATAARRRLLEMVSRTAAGRCIVLSGDVHHNRALELAGGPDGRPLGADFVATSISSGGDGADEPRWFKSVQRNNPHLKYVNYRRGYVRHVVDRDTWQADFRVLAAVSTPGEAIRTDARFRFSSRSRQLERL